MENRAGGKTSAGRPDGGHQGDDSGRGFTWPEDRVLPMAMAGLIWVCLLVVILLVVLPIWGGWAAAVTAGLSLAAVLLICFAIFSFGSSKTRWHL